MCNISKWNNKVFLLFFVAILIVGSAKGQLYGDYPYSEKFESAIQPGDITLPLPPAGSSKNNSATFTTNGVRLTEAKKNQFGAIFINNRQFSAINGMQVEFEYSMYGGTDGGADGFTFFLFDASVSNPTIGATGAGLGYSYNRATSTHSDLRNMGLSGAYLGISLDSYGNFKKRRYQGDALVNGINWDSYSTINAKGHVTLRGAKGAVINSSTSSTSNTAGLGDGYTGYPVLITQPTSGTSATNKRGVMLNADGSYSTISTYTGEFGLRSGAYATDPSSSNYRKAIVSMFPHESGGFLITVKIQHGTQITTVIDNYHYKTSLYYYENALVYLGDYYGSANFSPETPIRYTLNAAIPQFLRFGFAASTGAYTDNHYIRMIRVTLPGSAIANDDTSQTYSGISTTIDALKNDLGFSGRIIQGQVGSNTYLDKGTFKFVDKDNVVSPTPYEYTEAGVGTWKYNSSTGLVTFTPLSTFIGTATINYSIKGGIGNVLPYSDEAYRSLPASISVVVEKPINTHVVPNRFIQPTFK